MRIKCVSLVLCGIVVSNLLTVTVTKAQVDSFSKDDLIVLTTSWKGERFPDGRPKVPEDILERMKKVNLEDAYKTLQDNGYNYQFEGNWHTIPDYPVLVGRAVTARFMPLRPDMNEGNKAIAKKNGSKIGTSKVEMIDTLVKYDVPIVDIFGKGEAGTFVGDNLATRIYEKTGTGIVVDGNSIDLSGYRRLPNFPVFTRNWHPTHSSEIMMVSSNAPILLGRAVVLPGDVVLGDHRGVLFIPAHLAQQVVEESELIRLKDKFTQENILKGRNLYGKKWDDDTKKEYLKWLKIRKDELTPFQRKKLIEEQDF